MHNAHILVSQLKAPACDDNTQHLFNEIEQLSTLIARNEKYIFQNEGWTQWYDAMLVQAILKYGWVDKNHKEIVCYIDSTWKSIREKVRQKEDNDAGKQVNTDSTRSDRIVK